MNKILKEVAHELGFTIRTEVSAMPSFEVVNMGDADLTDDIDELTDALQASPGKFIEMESAYTPDGCYIGNVSWAIRLYSQGIVPELRQGSIKEKNHPCSIGFCERKQKWYGWSHRAIYGFGIGSVVRVGDCAYHAPTKGSFGRQMMDFFCSEDINPSYKDTVNADGVRGVLITATYPDDIHNERLRGTPHEIFWPYPDKFGRGEWVAETLEDAKLMAEDFAEGVS